MSVATLGPSTTHTPGARLHGDRLHDPLGDPDLSALLAGKPDDDPVPTLVWWLVAETVKASVVVSDVMSGRGGDKQLAQAIGEAELFADLALTELAAATGVGALRPRLRDVTAAVPAAAAVGQLRRTALPLARMLLAQVPTGPHPVAAALARHQRAIEHCRTTTQPAPALSADAGC